MTWRNALVSADVQRYRLSNGVLSVWSPQPSPPCMHDSVVGTKEPTNLASRRSKFEERSNLEIDLTDIRIFVVDWSTVSFIQDISIATYSSSSLLIRGAPDTALAVSEFHAEAPQATANEGLAQWFCVAARARFEPTTFQTKGVESTNEPPRPTPCY